MRKALALSAALWLALASSHGFAEYSGPTQVTPQGPLPFTPPTVINATDPQWAGGLKAGSGAAVQNAVVLQAAVNGACAAGRALISLPPWQFYVDTSAGEILVNCNYVSSAGQGNATTVIIWATTSPSTNNLFHVEPPGASTFGGNATFSNFSVFRNDSPTGGDIVFCDHCQYENFNNVRFSGGFHDLELLSSEWVSVDPQSIMGGVESNAGSSPVWVHSDGTQKSGDNKLLGDINTGTSASPFTYDYALVVQSTDGLRIGNHIAWGRLGDLLIQPQYANDVIDLVTSDTETVFNSTNGSCVAVEPYGAVILTAASATGPTLTLTGNAPSNINGYLVNISGYAANTVVSSGQGTSTLTLSNSASSTVAAGARVVLYPVSSGTTPAFTGSVTANYIYGECNLSGTSGATANAVQVDDPSVTFGGEISLREFHGQQAAIDIEAGANYLVSGQYYDNDKSNGSWPTMIVGGNATAVHVPWADFIAGATTPPEHILVTGQAQLLLGSSLFFSGATANVVNNSTNVTPGNLFAYSPPGSAFDILTWVGKQAAVITGTSSLNPAYLTLQANGNTIAKVYGSGAANEVDLLAEAATAGTLKIGVGNSDTVNLSGSVANINDAGVPYSTNAAPSIVSNACGSTSQGTVAGTNTDGLLTVGTTGVTSCTVSFSATLPNAPRTVVLTPANTTAAAQGTTAAYVSAITTAHWVLTGSALAGAAYYYHVE